MTVERAVALVPLITGGLLNGAETVRSAQPARARCNWSQFDRRSHHRCLGALRCALDEGGGLSNAIFSDLRTIIRGDFNVDSGSRKRCRGWPFSRGLGLAHRWFGVIVALAANAPIALSLGMIVGTEAQLVLSLAATDVGLGMMLLTVLLTPVAIHLATPQEGRQALLIGTFLLQSALIGAFFAADLATFYLCFEATLIPALWLLTRYGIGSEYAVSCLAFFVIYNGGFDVDAGGNMVIAATAGTLNICADFW